MDRYVRCKPESEEKYQKCECGNIVRYFGELSKRERCPRCERLLVNGYPVRRFEWLVAHGIRFAALNKIKESRSTTLCQD